jgi:hypothetical protein
VRVRKVVADVDRIYGILYNSCLAWHLGQVTAIPSRERDRCPENIRWQRTQQTDPIRYVKLSTRPTSCGISVCPTNLLVLSRERYYNIAGYITAINFRHAASTMEADCSTCTSADMDPTGKSGSKSSAPGVILCTPKDKKMILGIPW